MVSQAKLILRRYSTKCYSMHKHWPGGKTACCADTHRHTRLDVDRGLSCSTPVHVHTSRHWHRTGPGGITWSVSVNSAQTMSAAVMLALRLLEFCHIILPYMWNTWIVFVNDVFHVPWYTVVPLEKYTPPSWQQAFCRSLEYLHFKLLTGKRRHVMYINIDEMYVSSWVHLAVWRHKKRLQS